MLLEQMRFLQLFEGEGDASRICNKWKVIQVIWSVMLHVRIFVEWSLYLSGIWSW